MYQKRILPYIIIPYFLTPNFFPFGALQTDRQTEGRTNFNTPRYLTSFFFPLSARGPTRRRNSTGLAELWGGWPIERGKKARQTRKPMCMHADTSDATPTVEKKADLNGVGLTLNKHSRESKNSAYLRGYRN